MQCKDTTGSTLYATQRAVLALTRACASTTPLQISCLGAARTLDHPPCCDALAFMSGRGIRARRLPAV
eukprot:4389335-Pyramimonas_sp.AAC.1